MSLRLRGVRYRYAGSSRAVLDGIDLDVASGDVVGVVGPNDAGKSTLCLVAAGLAPAVIGGHVEGSLRIDDRETFGLRSDELAASCGMVFQDPDTQLSGTASTVWEEVAFGPRNLGLGIGEIVDRVEWALATVGIEALAPRNPERLSGGQAQLVALASVLALRPRSLVLDEPTSLLDPAGTRLVGEALAKLAADAGTAILIVEHKADLLARLATRVVVLGTGRIVLEGGTNDVLGDPSLAGLGVDPPEVVTIERTLRSAGLADRLAALDLPSLLATPAVGPHVARTQSDTQRPARGDAGTDAATAAIETEGLGFVYPGGTEALRSIGLRIGTGARVALVGQNGSGKSTLVRQCNGLLRPTRGVVRILGRDVGRRHVAELAAEVGLAFQDPDRQIFARRVVDEVAFGARNIGLRGTRLAEALDRALVAVGLEDQRDTNPFELGFSTRKLLAIASVLVMDSPIVILDEPTTGQDSRGTAQVSAVIAGLRSAGRTVLTISHDMRFVAEHADRILVLRAGEAVLDGTPDVVFSETNWSWLASTYLEPPLASRIGAALGLGSTPTVSSLVRAMEPRG
jgi:energy-coupling factor transport system ATP-binding protein